MFNLDSGEKSLRTVRQYRGVYMPTLLQNARPTNLRVLTPVEYKKAVEQEAALRLEFNRA